jgi:hypothetical protein
MTSEGAARTDVPHLWPTTLILPARPPLLVYLDLNHWIALSNAHAGRTERAAPAEVLAALIAAAQSGTAVFPISDTIYVEIGKMANRQYRRELREVIEMISGYRVITSRPDIATHEIETLLDARVSPNPTPINTLPYLDWGVARAFGRVGGFRIHNSEDNRDVTEEQRSAWPDGPEAFDAVFANAELMLNRYAIEGPVSDDDEEQLVALGYDRIGPMATQQRRADQENEQVERFNTNPKYRLGRIRDAIAARELAIELIDILTRARIERGVGITPIFTSRADIRGACDSMPSTDVSVTLKASYHRDPNRYWTVNDIADIDALASSVPYCDVVITDKRIADHANRTGLAERFGTTITPRLTDVVDRLS